MLFFLAIPPARAQVPEIKGVVFAGVQRGAITSVMIDGANLRGAKAILKGRGVEVRNFEPNEKGDYAEIQLSAASDAPLGPREIRLLSEKGVSNPARLWVHPFPNVRSTNPYKDAAYIQALTAFPVVVNGRMALGNNRDTYAFDAQAGETWVFDCNAAAICSRLDPVLELRDAGGHALKMAQSAWESDPRLVHRFEKTGRYFLTVRDTQYLGGADYSYLLTVGQLPVITNYLPRGGQPGQTVELQVEGVNLGKTRKVSVAIPAETPFGEMWASPQTDNGLALPLPLLVDPAPVCVLAGNTQTLSLPAPPVNLDGAFVAGSVQSYLFTAKPSDRLVFDLLGRRIGSRIDGALKISDGTKELAANDDAVKKDARLEFTPPEAKSYRLEMRNVEEKTGADCFYRLRIRSLAPDFRVMLNTDRLHIGAGGTIALPVIVERLAGFNAKVILEAEGLPAGVVCRGGVIEAGQNSGEFTLTAPPNTPLGASVLRLRGVATREGKRIERPVLPRQQYMPRSIDTAMFTDDSYRAPYREWEILPLGVIPRGEPFALETAVSEITLAPGGKVEIVVRALRLPEAKDEIKLELRGLPEKVKATLPAIPAGQTEARITLTAAPDAPAALRSLIIQGKLGSANQPAPALLLVVRR